MINTAVALPDRRQMGAPLPIASTLTPGTIRKALRERHTVVVLALMLFDC